MSEFIDIDPMKFNQSPFKLFNFDWTAITAEKPDGSINTMTASWGGLGIMWNKNVAFVVIRPQRFTKEFVDASSTLSLSFFGCQERQTMLYFGTFSGRDDDKIKRSGLTLTHIDNTPCFEEAEITLICEKLSAQVIDPASFIDPTIDEEQYPKKDYHTMYICEVKKVLVKKGTQIAEDCTK